ncbi:TetR/AcrR family transcriptional regulator [Crocosphaera sp.]|uniref:TetR/AcrR family transcriptional regulator n=1 Tax=Crocosphaera sp. TaxID=2729996 RepID=UPI00261A4A9F|nr:TetR/AcrR family transcriptional regulator [Crocosphaera sp.]MDJ0583006.1 TetR/AcrR family transcriptional regulator [Crocosphaera sp.]
MNQIDTRQKILETCKDLIQTKGYHGFTINEIAELLDISSSTVYHHFKNKENLVMATVIQYRNNFELILNEIEQESTSLRSCLEGLINIYSKVLEPDNKKICLCMTLIVEINTLPESIIEELKQFFYLQVKWIIKNIQQHKSEITILNHEIEMLVSSLEGIIAVARMNGGSVYFKSLAYSLLDNFLVAHQAKGK